MRKKTCLFSSVILYFLIYLITACAQIDNSGSRSLVNFSHLDRLYEEVTIANQQMGIIHIYSEYPDYSWIDAPGEGSACVDDVARGAVLYLLHYHYTKDVNSLDKAKKLLGFVLYMQAPNGLFYNFIYRDLTINKTRSNSQPRADWWAWRAIWALGEGLHYIGNEDTAYSNKLSAAITRTFPVIDSLLQFYPKTEINFGLVQPTWLPAGTAADQAAVLQLSLLAYFKYTSDPEVQSRIVKIAEGIMLMQAGDETDFPYGAFLSWRHTWHAWGNCQAYALLGTGDLFSKLKYSNPAITEIRYFHPYWIRENQLAEFSIRSEGDNIIAVAEKQYPQIAYGIRPQVWANLAAYKATEDTFYARQAGEIACWLLGKNTSGKILYDPNTGRCFDGLEDSKKINNNSGAESTLEALLTLIELENNPVTYKIVSEFYHKMIQDQN